MTDKDYIRFLEEKLLERWDGFCTEAFHTDGMKEHCKESCVPGPPNENCLRAYAEKKFENDAE